MRVIPITEDELTGFIFNSNNFADDKAEARRLARLMMASEQMYSTGVKAVDALAGEQRDIDELTKGLGVYGAHAILSLNSALAAAEGQK